MSNDLRRAIQTRVLNLDRLIAAKSASITSAPEGTLKVVRSHGYTRYIIQAPDGTKVSADRSTARRLAQHSYDSKIVRVAAKERDYLSKTIDSYPKPVVEDIYPALKPERMDLVDPVRTPDNVYIANWLAAPFKQKQDKSEYCIYKTKRGEMVRSKSELIIANRLFDLGIPYRYEAELVLRDGIIHPDFTILDIRRRREVYLEHCGKMSDPGYSADALNRINRYIMNDILPGDRLFLTLESDDVPLNMDVLDKILKGFAYQMS